MKAKITLKEQYRVDVEFYNASSLKTLNPGDCSYKWIRKYITLLTMMETEVFIRDLDTLMPESRGCRKCLDEYYLVPKIIRIIDTEENMVY